MTRLAAAFLAAWLARAAAQEPTDAEILTGELSGEVTSISGRDVTIAIRGFPYVPRVGDRVELFRVRSGFATLVGEWRVSYAEGDDIRATAGEGRGEAAKGMSAIVYSALPAGILSRIGFENTPRPQLPVAEAVKWTSRHLDLEKRAKQAYADAQRYLAMSPPDTERVVAALRQAAGLNHPQAAAALSRLLTQDRGEALAWQRLAAELGDADAQFATGEAYELANDAAKARAWYRKAAAQGSENARARLRQLSQ